MAAPNFNDALRIITDFQRQLLAQNVTTASIEEFKNFASAFSNLANFDAAAVAENLTAFSAIGSTSWNSLSQALTSLSPILVNLGSNPQVKDGATTLSVLSSALVGFTEINFSKLTTSIGKLLLFNRLLSLPGMLKAVTGAFKNLGGMISGLGKSKDVAKGAEVLGNIAAGLNALQNISFGKLLRSILTILTLMPLLKNLFTKLAELMERLKDSRPGARALDLITKSFTALGEVKWIKVLLGTFALDRLKKSLENIIPTLQRLGGNAVSINRGLIVLQAVADAVSKWGSFKIIFGVINMTLASIALGLIAVAGTLLGLASPLIYAGAAALDRLKKSLENIIPTFKMLGRNADIINKGLTVLGAVAVAVSKWGSPKVFLGVISMALASIALRSLDNIIPTLQRLGGNAVSINKGLTVLGAVGDAVSKWGSFKIIFGLINMTLASIALVLITVAGTLLGLASPLIYAGAAALEALGAAINVFGGLAANPLFWLGILALGALAVIALILGVALVFAGVGAILLAVGLTLLIIPLLLLGLISGLIILAAAALTLLSIPLLLLGLMSGLIILAAGALTLLIIPLLLLGLMSPLIILAAVGLTLLIIPLLLLGLMSPLIILAATALVVLGLAIVAFAAGMLMFSPAIIISIGLLIGLAAAVFILGLAFKHAGEGVSASLVPFIELSGSADKLMKAARAITAIGLAIAGFRMAVGVSGIFSRILNFFGIGDSDTLTLLKDIAGLSSALDKTAAALERILFAADAIDSMNLKNKNAQKIKDGVKATADGLETSSSAARGKMSTGNSATVNNTVINNASSNPSTVVNNFGVNHGERTNGLFGFAMVGAT